MAGRSLEDQSLDELLGRVQGLSSMAAASEVQSIMAVFAKCTLELRKVVDSTSTEIRRFNESTTKLETQIIRLNKVLVGATIVGAVAAIIGAIATFSK